MLLQRLEHSVGLAPSMSAVRQAGRLFQGGGRRNAVFPTDLPMFGLPRSR